MPVVGSVVIVRTDCDMRAQPQSSDAIKNADTSSNLSPNNAGRPES
jgi:hypothetical protein